MYAIQSEDLTIRSGNKTIFGRIHCPLAEGRHPLVILSHGYNGNHSDFEPECRFFAENGLIAFSFDFCGGSVRSKSSGASTDMTLFTEKEDLLSVIDALSAFENVDPDAVYLLGGSQGGLVTALAAEERANLVKAMILYFPAFNIPDDWQPSFESVEQIPETFSFWGLTLGRNFFASMRDFSSFDHVGSFKNPVLILQGDKDEIVRPSVAEKAASRYDQAKLVILPGEGHGFSPEGSRKAVQMALDWILTSKA